MFAESNWQRANDLAEAVAVAELVWVEGQQNREKCDINGRRRVALDGWRSPRFLRRTRRR